MKPTPFPQATKTLGKPAGWTDAQCGSLPVHNDGVVSISCWSLSWRERLVALLTGRVWLRVHSGATQPPVSLEVTHPFVPRAEWPKRERILERVGRLAAVLLIAVAATACGDDSTSPTAPAPVPSPTASASPTPVPVDACQVRRSDMIATRVDQGHKGDLADAWPTGVVPVLSVFEKFAGDFQMPPLPTSNCPEIDKHTWGQDGASTAHCILLGNETANARPCQCITTGYVTIIAQAQGVNVEPARRTFHIQPGEALSEIPPGFEATRAAQIASGAALKKLTKLPR